jgi:hypothetical protein
MSARDLRCPPSDTAAPATAEKSILALAARARAASDEYRACVDAEKLDFRAALAATNKLARAVDALTSAIADAVACGDNRLS